MILPRIRHLRTEGGWLLKAALVGYPRPGIGVVVTMYEALSSQEWIVCPEVAYDR